MRKLTIRVVAVVVTTAAIYIGVIMIMFALGKVNLLPNVKYPLGGYGHTLVRMQEAQKAKDIDIIFIGSSHVYRGFDTRIFEKHNIRTFNLGTSSQSPFVSYYLLKEYLPSLKPRIVVMDLFWGALSMSSVEAGADIIANSEVNESIVDMAWETKDVILLNGLLLSKIYQSFYPLDTTIQGKFKFDQYIEGGFVQTSEKENRLSEEELTSLKPTKIEPAKIQLEYLRKIITLCKNHNIQLVFTVAPVTSEYLESIENHEEYSSLINRIANESGAALIDYTGRDLNLSSKYDFYDAHHLSQSGVAKFNEVFIKELKELVQERNGKIPRKSDINYN